MGRKKIPFEVCSVEGCNNTLHYAKGLCKAHYFKEYNSRDNPIRFQQLKSIRLKYFQSEKGKQAMKGVMGRRRARKRGANLVETFSHKEIFERDFYTCAICGLPVPVNERHPARLSASLDHKIPLSKGGNHSFDNVACTHLLCNVSKNASIIENCFDGASI